MAIFDKIQGGIEKLTNDDTRLNTAEITTLQQAYNAMQLGLVKNEFYINQAQSEDVRHALTELRDEFLKPNLERPRRILNKLNVPSFHVDVENRLSTIPKTPMNVLRDEEILLDTILAMQATITGLQAGALAAIRGDVRDFFLNARDAAFDQWRKLGMVAYKTAPQLIPPVIAGDVQTAR